MVVRKISKGAYAIALIITVVVFSLGFLLGEVVQTERARLLEDLHLRYSVEYASGIISYEYLEENMDDVSCEILYESYKTSLDHLAKTQFRLETYVQQQSESERLTLIRREYFLTEIKYLLLAQKIKERCDSDFVVVMFFHADEAECSNCDRQAFVLNYLKDKYGGKVLIFSFALNDIEEQAITILRQIHEIEQTPTVLIGEERFEGFTTREVLEEEVCKHLSSC